VTASRNAGRLAAYAWTSPNTLLGAAVGLFALALGGRLRLHEGVAEFSGGRLGILVASLPPQLRFSAITFGHVVIGVSEAMMAAVRCHERVHVRQYERWGPLFLPAYLLSSAWQLARGRSPYRDNYFERAAFAAEGDGRVRRTPSVNLARARRPTAAP
jgi:hypothetical protein